MLLDIKIKPLNQSLDLGIVTINFLSKSPLFEAKIVQNYISYNVTILATPTNLRLLKIPNIIESSDPFEAFKVDIIIENSAEIEADLKIQEANDQYIIIRLNAVDFDADFLDEALSSFDLGDDIDIGPNTSDVFAHVIDANTKEYPDTSHVFPMIHNPEFYGDDNIEYLGVINNYDITGAIMVANTNTPVKNKNVLVPYFFLIYIFKQIFETNGITIKGEFIDDVDIQKIILHNNFALDEFDIERTFVRASLTSDFLLTNSTNEHLLIWDDDSTFPNEDTGGDYDTVLGEFTIPQTGILNYRIFNLKVTNYTQHGAISYVHQQIVITLYIDGVERGVWSDFIQQNEVKEYPEIIVSGFFVFFGGVGFYVQEIIDITAADVGKKIVLKAQILSAGDNPNPSAKIESGAIAEIYLDKWTDYNVFSKSITPTNHMPNMTGRDFVNSFIKGFKLMPYFDKVKKELYLDYFETLVTSNDYDDISDKIKSSSIKEIENKGFKVNYDFSGDELKPENTPDISKFQFIGEFDSVSDLTSPISVSLLVYIKNINAYYVSMITVGITWERYTEGFDDFIIGDGSTPYIIDYSPFIMGDESIDNDGAGTMLEFLLPKITEQGSSLFYSIGINDPFFKIMNWHGMVDGPTPAKPYPFASSYHIDQNGNNVGNLSFRLSIEEESVEFKYLMNYFNFLINTKKVEYVYTTNLVSPLTYNFSEKKLIINQRFLTGQLKLKITANGFERIVAENYKI